MAKENRESFTYVPIFDEKTQEVKYVLEGSKEEIEARRRKAKATEKLKREAEKEAEKEAKEEKIKAEKEIPLKRAKMLKSWVDKLLQEAYEDALNQNAPPHIIDKGLAIVKRKLLESRGISPEAYERFEQALEKGEDSAIVEVPLMTDTDKLKELENEREKILQEVKRDREALQQSKANFEQEKQQIRQEVEGKMKEKEKELENKFEKMEMLNLLEEQLHNVEREISEAELRIEMSGISKLPAETEKALRKTIKLKELFKEAIKKTKENDEQGLKQVLDMIENL